MSDLSKSSSGLLTGIFLGVILVCAPALPTYAGEAASGDPTNTGEIHIEGEHISHLILRDSRGGSKGNSPIPAHA